MLCREGKLSLITFLTSILISISIAIFGLCFFKLGFDTLFNSSILLGGVAVGYVLYCLLALFCLPRDEWEIVKRAALLGFVLGISCVAVNLAPFRWKAFAVYFIFMPFFHFSEYLTIAWSNPRSLNTDTFMLTHSAAYIIAAASSWIEFIVEVYLYPSLKESFWPLVLGSLVCIAGEVLRKLAIITANTNFNHLVQFRKVDGHTLITHGVYKYMRHPSYSGWFFWSIGTQIVLSNPICVVLYAIVSWKFFHERILVEEVTLVNFFQAKYVEYQQRTPTGVPFVRGYVVGAYEETDFKQGFSNH